MPPPQSAQPLDDMAHMSWTRRDGAPADIAALAQTEDGYLWIGSRRGLFRFDGLQFQSYPFTPDDPQLPASDIAALAADRDGGLWIGYRMGGITYLSAGKKIDYDRASGLISESTEQLLCRPDGSVWATADGRLMHLTGPTWENYSARHGLSSEGLYSLFFDREGNLWTADKGHIYELKKGEDKFSLIDIPNGTVNQFLQLEDGSIWISDAWKSVRPLLDAKGAHAVRIPGVPVMLNDSHNNVWLANEFGGLTRIRHPGTDQLQVEKYGAANGLTDGQTRAILQDRQGTIWVATARGLDRFRPSPLVQFRGVQLDYYPALLADRNDGIWLHDMDKPLMRLRSGKLTFIGEGHGSSSLFQDTDGSVWMLDQITHDFYRYKESGGAPTRIPSPDVAKQVETWCLGKDRQGALLGCFEGHGLWRYFDGAWNPVKDPGLPQESPLSLARGEGGRLWLGYPHNQIALDEGHGYHAYGRKDGVEVTSVFTFYDAGGLVLAGGSDGLAFFDGKSFHSLHLRSPELLRGISGIVRDGTGDLWLNAGLGIVRLPSAEWKRAMEDPRYAMDFQLINDQDGLIGSPTQSKPAPSAVIDKTGVLWFATSGHLVAINPAAARQSGSTPNLLLQAIVVNGKVRSYTKGMPITESSLRLKTLEFDYNGVDLNSPERVVYQYKLVGQDKDWQDVGSRRQAYYTNLSPGKYQFHVRAATGTGPWSELQTPLRLTVTPAYYQTRWFFAVCFFVVFGLLWLIYRARLEYLTSQVQERLEERAHERIRIARDLHDTLLQGVQGLMLRFHFATEQLPAEEPVRAILRDALDRADVVIQEGREKVRELRAEAGSQAELETHLRKAAIALQADGMARITVLVTGEPRILHPAVNDELYSIGREALTNAVRHADATQVILELGFDDSQVRLRCRDNGRGVSPQIVEAGFKEGHWGIIGMRERARSLGCKLEFASTPGAGTEVQVCVSGRRAYSKIVNNGRTTWQMRLSPFLRNSVPRRFSRIRRPSES
ncbi:Adenylate cyclase [Acidisarcina polymorpha]|uniref:Adenylate cyclase n=1 Tax=Acidisarcina polymorpha TaxID=2211140 RepID=A0A2Z5FV17_9BACT|nr:Adenylate cyclase [Acidisarcina polymorpha]